MQFLKDLSIRQKLMSSFIFILLILAVQSYLSNLSLSKMNEDITQIVNINQPASIKAEQLNAILKDTSRALGFYIITQEQADLQAYNFLQKQLQGQLESLKSQAAIQNNDSYTKLLNDIEKSISETSTIQDQLLAVVDDPNQNMPAMQFSAENINPNYRARLQLLSAMLEAEQEEEASEDRKLLTEAIVSLRYYWTTINNELRLFLAFRTKAATENTFVYRDAAKAKLTELMELSEFFTFEQEDAMEQFNDGIDEYWANIDQLFEIHNAEDWRSDAFLLRKRVAPALFAIGQEIEKLVKSLQSDSQKAADIAAASYTSQQTQLLIAFAVIFMIVLALGLLLSRNISKPVRQAVNIANQIANANLNNKIKVDSKDETGEMLSTLDRMQTDLRNRIESDAKTAAENLRIRQALDNVSVSVTVSNDSNELIYVNHAAQTLVKSLEAGIRSIHPEFSSDHLIGDKVSNYIEDADLKVAYQRKLNQQEEYDTVIASRNLHLITSPVYDDSGTYQGRVTQWNDVTDALLAAEQERERIESERIVAAENARIRTALDNVSSNVMLADSERNIIYMNKNVTRLFTEVREDIQSQLPNFDPEKLLGANIDQFHINPNHQIQILENLADTYESELKIGDITMKIIANPVMSEDGTRLGTAVEWTDRTQEVAVEKEIDSLVDAAKNGNLSQRIDVSNKKGFFRQLGEGFNALLNELSSVFSDIAQIMSKMADGDLSQSIDKQYSGTFGEVKDDINKTIKQLHQILSDVTELAGEVSDTSNEISTGNNSLSSRTEQQAASLEQTASSMEELTSTVQHNAQNAQQANQLASTSRQSAEKGGAVVANAISAMNEISTSSNKIAEIIGVIDEIAFQTNLLALNASVEAARAGEQGRGFAVVATEVRNLASRSAEAAREIKELIQDSQKKVNSGTELVNQSGQTLELIVDDVKKVGDIVAEIAASSAEQSSGIEQVNNAVNSMDELTQQNAALAEETSSASASMSEKSRQMAGLVGFFKLSQAAMGSMSQETPTSVASKPVAVQSVAPRTGESDEWEEF